MSCYSNKICVDHRGPYEALKRAQAFPDTLVKAKTALEPRHRRLDPRSESPEASVEIFTSVHVRHTDAASFGKANIPDLFVLGFLEVGLGCKSSVQSYLEGIASEEALLPVEHISGQGAIGRFALCDKAVGDQVGVYAALRQTLSP